MGLPPTSPRLKFTHTHPGGSPVHRRPPRHPPTPSTRSRSLELLDQDEKKSVSPIREPEPQPRPRSRSLDGLLDEDGLLPEMKTEESAKQKPDQESKTNSEPMEAVNRLVVPEKAGRSEPEAAGRRVEGGQVDGKAEVASLENNSKENEDPTPVPRQRTRTAMEAKESKRITTQEEPNNREENPPIRPPKPNRFISMDAHLLNTDEQGSKASSENVDPCAGNTELKERLVATGNDKSTLLKAKSCGAGLDSDESISSSEYKPKTKEQGSLLSLPTGAEPKRKKNFMDKCVNKVRSFMRK